MGKTDMKPSGGAYEFQTVQYELVPQEQQTVKTSRHFNVAI